jgi:hypothetical protein
MLAKRLEGVSFMMTTSYKGFLDRTQEGRQYFTRHVAVSSVSLARSVVARMSLSRAD